MDECDVILDSGADTSALPPKYAAVGVGGPKLDTCFVDAQGTPLNVQTTRLANIQFGDVIFRERFIMSDVTCPLLSLGNVLRAGWSVVHVDGVPCLTKGDKQIEVLSKNNSLRARGQISVVSELDAAASKPCSASCRAWDGFETSGAWLESHKSPFVCHQNHSSTTCEYNFVPSCRTDVVENYLLWFSERLVVVKLWSFANQFQICSTTWRRRFTTQTA